jgi:hypothetical protein
MNGSVAKLHVLLLMSWLPYLLSVPPELAGHILNRVAGHRTQLKGKEVGVVKAYISPNMGRYSRNIFSCKAISVVILKFILLESFLDIH